MANNEIPENMLDDFISIREAAESLLHIHADTLRNAIEDGSLPAYRLGSRLIRVRKSDLLKLFHQIPSAVTK